MNFGNEKTYLAILLILTLAFRLPFINTFPFLKDEALYAEITDEMIESPSLLPHYLGQVTEWRPPFAFQVYAAFAIFLNKIPGATPEFVYRFPSIVFALLSVFILYFLIKEIYKDIHLAFLASLIFSTTELVALVNATFLVDSLLLFLILAGVYCYIKGEKKQEYFLLAGAFFFFAFFTKTVVAFLIPVLGVAYYFFSNKRMLSNKFFLFSLSSIPLALAVYLILFTSGTSSGAFNFLNLYKQYLKHDLITTILTSVIPFISRDLVWLPVFAVGLASYWRKEKFMSFWFLLIIFPVLIASFLHWYYLPIIPAISLFAAKAIGKHDYIAEILVVFCILLNAYAVYFFYIAESGGEPVLTALEEKEIGVLMAGKQRVLLLSDYRPSVVIYKHFYETPNLPIGMMVITHSEHSNASFYEQAVYNYSYIASHPDEYNVQTDASQVFIVSKDWIVPTSLASFDYIVAKSFVYSDYLHGNEDFQPVANSSRNSFVVLKRVNASA